MFEAKYEIFPVIRKKTRTVSLLIKIFSWNDKSLPPVIGGVLLFSYTDPPDSMGQSFKFERLRFGVFGVVRLIETNVFVKSYYVGERMMEPETKTPCLSQTSKSRF